MCELIFSHMRDPLLNRIAILSLMTEDSEKLNKDGCGVFTVTAGIYKTEKTGSLINNLGEILSLAITDTNPVMAHVRAATAGLISNKKTVDSDHSHPFDGPHYVLAHNGMLEFKDKANADKYAGQDLIDSQIFTAELNSAYTGDPVADLQNTMGKFAGKFAFLVYHKDDCKFYAARGKTAKLHGCSIYRDKDELVGYLINTDKDDLSIAALRMCNFAQIMGYSIHPNEVVELEQEQIFLLNEAKVEKVGQIIETPKPSASTTTTSTRDAAGTTWMRKTTTDTTDTRVSEAARFLQDSGLTIPDLDEVANIVIGKSLLELTNEDIDFLVKAVIPELDKRNCPKTITAWQHLSSLVTPSSKTYKAYGLQFPYMLNDWRAIRRHVIVANK